MNAHALPYLTTRPSSTLYGPHCGLVSGVTLHPVVGVPCVGSVGCVGQEVLVLEGTTVVVWEVYSQLAVWVACPWACQSLIGEPLVGVQVLVRQLSLVGAEDA
jgi:hypothetical protein